MVCRQCASPLDRPGDYCLVCHTPNADTVVLELSRERARVTALLDEEIVAAREITTTPESGEDETVELRNFASLIADDVRRKRPEEVYATGDRSVLTAVRTLLHYSLYRIEGENAVESVIERRGKPALDVVTAPLSEKLGGSHTTLIGGRSGREAVETVAEHPHVKKLVPGPIDASGGGSRSGVRAKATRADNNGNVRLLVRDGSSVQENRIVTTAYDRDTGERVREDLNEALQAATLQE
ncbi:DUF2103 domain-containing protein [Halocatena pleomorpha]|uniref:Metal-binding protein n=1 Tax=Halocatena pleomorpha TaxID=1785090 RepID=A0A3P3RE02_9EURY|nr:DUF2103 domain-containing protein [Halocatena pleomorpha]RRJ31169.1 metal-binding protein [Halocatena pleomorpha]